tara:strand:+ start:4147 stop:5028 length:882 start_codon:yes stop_codon:yes gene_type:complete
MRFLFFLLFSLNLIAEDHRSKIVIIDAGYITENIDLSTLCRGSSFYYKNSLDLEGYQMHISNVIGSLLENLDTENFCVYPISTLNYGQLTAFSVQALYTARSLTNVSGINISMVGYFNEKEIQHLKNEEELILDISRKNIVMTFAAGNNHDIIESGNCYTYPICHLWNLGIHNNENLKVVTSIDNCGNLEPISNLFASQNLYGEDGFFNGELGTSFSAPRLLGKIFSGNVLIKMKKINKKYLRSLSREDFYSGDIKYSYFDDFSEDSCLNKRSYTRTAFPNYDLFFNPIPINI